MDRSDLLNDAERRLWDAFPRGTLVDLGDGDPTTEDFDPDLWSEDRHIRGEVIARLLLGVREQEASYVARVSLRGARIVGELSLSGGEISYELALTSCWVNAPPDFTGATCGRATFHRSYLPGLIGSDWHVRGSASFSESRCCGELRLVGAHVGGQLDFDGATLTNPDGPALIADGLIVDQSMFCRKGVIATGEIRLPGAHIGGQLNFDGATLTNPDGSALIADRLIVDQSMFCQAGFTATGEIRLLGAHIGGQLAFNSATLTNPNGPALNARRLTVDHDVLFREGFTAIGAIRLIGAHIGGQLSFSGATLTNPGGLALDLEAIQCPYVWLPPNVEGRMDLSRARLGTLNIPKTSTQAPMRLTSLTYTDLDPDPDPPVRQRIAWLRRDPARFHPQPYEHLAAYYRSIGHDRDARRVLLAKQRTRRRTMPDTWQTPGLLRTLQAIAWRIPGWLVDALSGYGYVPWRAFCWLVAAVAGGAALLHDVAPTTPTTNTNINALLLALDATVPTAPFGIREQVTLTGAPFITAMSLQILGYALLLAVLPAASRTLNRTDK